MRGEQHPARASLRALRERVILRLSDAFSQDELGLEDFELRIDAAYRSASMDDLDALVRDLSPSATAEHALVAVGTRPPELGSASPQRALIVAGSKANAPPRVLAVLGNVERGGARQIVDGSRATAVFGNIELDLRDAIFEPGTTRLHVSAVFGNVEITVPPELAVECDGPGILGSFSSMHRVPAEGSDGQPVLRISGRAIFGNVEIHTRPRAPLLGPNPALPPNPKR